MAERYESFPGARGEETRRSSLLARPEAEGEAVTKDKCVHRLEGVAGRRSELTPR